MSRVAFPWQARTGLVLAAVVVSLVARPALADGPTSVVVLPYAPLYGEVPQSTGDKAAELIRNELEANKSFKLGELAEGKKAADKKSAEDEIEAAKKEIADAKAQFDKAAELAKGKKFKPAADAYEKGIEKFQASFQGADDFKALSEAYVQLAIVRVKLGNEDEAVKLLADLVRLDPERVLAAPEVAPLFAKFHEKERKNAFAKSRGTLKIVSTPAGARVLFDGRAIGETPLVAKAVLPGEHYVRVVKTGQGAYWKKIKVVSGEEQQVAGDLAGEGTGPMAGIAKALSQNTLDEATIKAVQKVGQTSKVDYVVFGALHKDGDNVAAKSYALKVKDGSINELVNLLFDQEMIGAAIEVLKLANDLDEKVKDFPGTQPTSALALFEGVEKQGGGDETVAMVVVAPASVDSPKSDEPASPRRGRGPIVKNSDEEEKPAEEQKQVASGDEKPADEAPVIVKRKEKCGPGDEACWARRRGEQAAAPKAEEKKDDEPEITLKRDKKKNNALDEALADEDAEAARKEKAGKVDLTPKGTLKSRSAGAALSPEEIEKLNQMDQERAKNEGSNTGKYVLWGAVGAVGIGAIATGAYFLLAPSAPTSATAHISWNP